MKIRTQRAATNIRIAIKFRGLDDPYVECLAYGRFWFKKTS
jgi:hypothetical protein